MLDLGFAGILIIGRDYKVCVVSIPVLDNNIVILYNEISYAHAPKID